MAEPYDAPNVIPIRSGLGGVRDTAPLPKGDGGGTSDGMGPWEQSVESRLTSLGGSVDRLGDKVDARFDTLIKAYAGGFVFIILAFAGGFVLLSQKIDDRTDKLMAKLDALSAQVSQVGERVAKLEGAAEAKAPPITPQSPAK